MLVVMPSKVHLEEGAQNSTLLDVSWKSTLHEIFQNSALLGVSWKSALGDVSKTLPLEKSSKSPPSKQVAMLQNSTQAMMEVEENSTLVLEIEAKKVCPPCEAFKFHPMDGMKEI